MIILLPRTVELASPPAHQTGLRGQARLIATLTPFVAPFAVGTAFAVGAALEMAGVGHTAVAAPVAVVAAAVTAGLLHVGVSLAARQRARGAPT